MRLLIFKKLLPIASLIIIGLPSSSLVHAQPDTQEQPDPQKIEQLNELDREVTQKAQQLGDWSEQYELISDAIENIWTQNGWNNEADLWAKNTALEISKIPPWQFQERMQSFSDQISKRYSLDADQVNQFHNQINKEMFYMGMKYAPVGLKQAMEALDTRAQGKPFTPEQIARWVKESDPLIDDWQKDIKRITSEFKSSLTPQQQKILDRDLSSVDKRVHRFLELRLDWRDGKWRAEDWGLQNDPIHAQDNLRPSGIAHSLPVLSTAVPHDESTWEKYVKAFIKLYNLDESQQNTCTSILNDLVTQARKYRQSHKVEIEKVPAAKRPQHALWAPILRMFEELKSRLNYIPTKAQQRQALEKRKTDTIARPSRLPKN